jgi:hypothetical protein
LNAWKLLESLTVELGKAKFWQMIKVLLEKRGKSKPPHESPTTKK